MVCGLNSVLLSRLLQEPGRFAASTADDVQVCLRCGTCATPLVHPLLQALICISDFIAATLRQLGCLLAFSLFEAARGVGLLCVLDAGYVCWFPCIPIHKYTRLLLSLPAGM